MSQHHKFKIGQVLKYEEFVLAKVLECLPWDAEMDFTPVYRVKLLKSGMEMVLQQHDMKPFEAKDLLFNQPMVDLLCDCGAKHTVDWNVHSAWCSVTDGLGGAQYANIRSNGS
jgi:hypothetical protein